MVMHEKDRLVSEIINLRGKHLSDEKYLAYASSPFEDVRSEFIHYVERTKLSIPGEAIDSLIENSDIVKYPFIASFDSLNAAQVSFFWDLVKDHHSWGQEEWLMKSLICGNLYVNTNSVSEDLRQEILRTKFDLLPFYMLRKLTPNQLVFQKIRETKSPSRLASIADNVNLPESEFKYLLDLDIPEVDVRLARNENVSRNLLEVLVERGNIHALTGMVNNDIFTDLTDIALEKYFTTKESFVQYGNLNPVPVMNDFLLEKIARRPTTPMVSLAIAAHFGKPTVIAALLERDSLSLEIIEAIINKKYEFRNGKVPNQRYQYVFYEVATRQDVPIAMLYDNAQAKRNFETNQRLKLLLEKRKTDLVNLLELQNIPEAWLPRVIGITED